MGDGVNLAVDTPVAEAARYQNAVHALKQCPHIVGCHRFGIYPTDVDDAVVGDAAVF